MQVQLAADIATACRAPAIARILLPRAAVLAVTHDRMPDLGHMGAQLMGAACHRFQSHPGQARTKKPQGEIIGLGPLGTLCLGHFGRMHAQHLFALAAAPAPGGLDQPELDGSLAGVGHACHHGPVDLAGLAVAQRLGQGAGDAVCPGQQQHTGGVLVQPVHQLGLFLVAEFQRLGQSIDMPRALPRPTLRGQPGRLVKDNHMLVLPQDGILNHPGVGLCHTAFDRLGCFAHRQGRHPDFHARHHAVRGLYPPAIHTHLTGAAHLFDSALSDVREAALEPAVKTLLALVPGHGQHLDGTHANHSRVSDMPSASAVIEAATEPTT